MANYQDFLKEFYDLIDVPLYDPPDYREFDLPNLSKEIHDLDSFRSIMQNLRGSYLWSAYGSFGSGITPVEAWSFYQGSYKVFFEEFQSLHHLDTILRKAIKNPLVQCAHFAIIG